MKKLLMGLLMLLAPGAANAAWTLAATSNSFGGETSLYFDRSTLQRSGNLRNSDGNLRKMWSLMDFKKAQVSRGKSTLSERSQDEYDCSGQNRTRRLALYSYSGQMGSGEVAHFDLETAMWARAPTGSLLEVLWNIACGYS